MKAIKTYKMKESAVNIPLYAGSVLAIIALVSFLVTMQPLFLPGVGISVFLVVISLMNKNRETIKLYEDHMELKFAPASPLHLIRYQDLLRLEDKNKNLKRLYFLSEGKEKKIWIQLNQHEKEDMEEFIRFLQEKIEAKKD
ncbi:hypothetical protein [Moheibacter sp.]|uniref:hypothetical protein n=1 Tax=Moheibacter sp. TaxID=1965316 RepID=UPI003C707A30